MRDTASALCEGVDMAELQISEAGDIDPAILAAIRVEAMRPSLEVVGRFDPERAWDRFLAGYSADETRLVRVRGVLVGFFVVRRRADHHCLDHLYIRPIHQGGGLGRKIVRLVQQEANAATLPVKLMALRESPSNAFYRSCGFDLVRSDQLDNHYVWDLTKEE